MATAARSLSRMANCLVLVPRVRSNPVTRTKMITPPATATRSFSAPSFRLMASKDGKPGGKDPESEPEDIPIVGEYSPENLSEEERAMYEKLSPEERAIFDEENHQLVKQFNDPTQRASILAEVERSAAQIERETPVRYEDAGRTPRGFWSMSEDDEFAKVEDGDDDFNDDEITSMAHAEVDLHREMREYARIAAWDMPLLSSKFYLFIYLFIFFFFLSSHFLT